MITRKKCDSYNEIMAGLMTRFVYLLDERRLIVFTNVSTTRRTCLILFEPFHDVEEVTSMRASTAPYVQASDHQVTQTARVGDVLTCVTQPSGTLQRTPAEITVNAIEG